jgi:hypothetical protein
VSNVILIRGGARLAFFGNKDILVSDVQVDTDLGKSVGTLGHKALGGFVGDQRSVIVCLHVANFISGF